MTKEESVWLTIYTDTLLCDINDLLKFLQDFYEEPIYTHQISAILTDPKLQKYVKDKIVDSAMNAKE